jgi:hypothetical protein
MPITAPELVTSGPPESPDWMSAFVWIRPVRCAVVPYISSPTEMLWFSAVTEPPAADGVPPLPPALPTPTIASPTCTVDELPIVAVVSPDAPFSCRRAISPDGS